MHLIETMTRRLRARAIAEDGFTMATAMLAAVVVTLAMAATVTAVNGDINFTTDDLDQKRAYEAAQAGLADYSFHVSKDNGYWAKCTSVPTPNAVNNVGSTAKRRNVPGNTGATYALELIPATGKSVCSTSDPVGSMIEQTSGASNGTFRIRSTGFSGDAEVRIVASFKRASFLDYVYFTQLETIDPIAYGFTDPTSIASANSQCSKMYRDGRQDNAIANTGGRHCSEITFIANEKINGPLHTNDELSICGNPTFGRSPADLIEVGSKAPGYRSSGGGCSANPIFKGTYLTNAPVLTPPSTNDSLKTVPGAALYTGRTTIVLNGTQMTVTTASGSTSTVPIPSSGVIYVANSGTTSCSSYSPFTAPDPTNTSPGCGNVILSGSYSGQLTIAAENDIVIKNDVQKSTPEALLGLIANNFIRVHHPLSGGPPSTTSCNGASNSGSSPTNIRVDAAMLAIQHSFVVDHYNCGNPLGTLTVNGAISQKFRGPVGTFSGSSIVSGYIKDYNYDDRLRYLAPPKFLDPVESGWHMQRQTLDP